MFERFRANAGPAWVFVALTAALTAVCYPPFLIYGETAAGAPFAVVAMFSPTLAAVATTLIFACIGRHLAGGWAPCATWCKAMPYRWPT